MQLLEKCIYLSTTRRSINVSIIKAAGKIFDDTTIPRHPPTSHTQHANRSIIYVKAISRRIVEINPSRHSDQIPFKKKK